VFYRFRHPDKPSEATAARVKAELALERTKAETPVFQRLAERLIEVREINHFEATFRRTIQGGHR
jgi:hypothetical protein